MTNPSTSDSCEERQKWRQRKNVRNSGEKDGDTTACGAHRDGNILREDGAPQGSSRTGRGWGTKFEDGDGDGDKILSLKLSSAGMEKALPALFLPSYIYTYINDFMYINKYMGNETVMGKTLMMGNSRPLPRFHLSGDGDDFDGGDGNEKAFPSLVPSHFHP
ncbi:hypothetical protein TIFTF001_010126 [Ficus carica]|uniref:Uncharacterized protein n=1 Tax=Ficus carica TaxID=3494 RepID=A0AA87ZWI2_FICCA|nr:hypothetical protein TIFTF001_010126 [Ficus carica]